MSSPQRNSDTEGSEKPVRERLRNTSIAVAATTRNGTVYQSTETAEVADSVPETMPSTEEISTSSTKEVTTTEPFKDATPPREEDQDRGRPSRKRSHEDMGEDTPDEPAPKTRHARKRSRETVEDEQQDVSPDSIISEDHPQNKADTNGTVKTAVPQRVASTNKRPTPASDQDDPTSVVDIASPKSKKSRPDETKLNDASQPPQVAPAQAADSEKPKVDSSAAVVESATEEKKSQELPTALDKPSVEGEQPPTAKPAAIPSTSGFANVSSSSPFGALAGSKSPADQNTSTSAFKASGFGALSNSTPSGFGSLSGPPSKLSSFSSSSAAPAPAAADAAIENDKTTPKTFGGAMGTASGFASAKTGSSSAFSGALGASSSFASAGTGNVSAFGGKSGGVLSPPGGKSGFSSGLGGGFGGGFGGMGGSKLGSFASSGTPGVIGGFSKPARQFGAAPDDEEGEDGSGAEDDAAGEAKPDNDDEKDERFFEQESTYIVHVERSRCL